MIDRDKKKKLKKQRVQCKQKPKEQIFHKCELFMTYKMLLIYEKENIPCLNLIHKTGKKKDLSYLDTDLCHFLICCVW